MEVISVEKLIDLSIDVGLVPHAKFQYQWDTFSNWQFDTLLKLGLKPEHKFIDFGCGSLRLAVKAIPYLNEGNYYGIDPFVPYMELGKKILEELKITKKYTILESSKFELEKFNQAFDFGIAQSVFTHLSLKQIEAAVIALKNTMAKGGVFVFTFIVSNKMSPRGFFFDDAYEPMIDSPQCTKEFYAEIAAKYDIKYVADSDITHPSQNVGIFYF